MKRRVSYLLKKFTSFAPKEVYSDGHSALTEQDRAWEDFYRKRWQHDKRVRTTHGVNCTGSCSWWVHVKNGLITWETQALDYPTTGPDFPEYEPRGCQRGASFSWYVYSPLRVKYPYVRGTLLEAWRKAKEKNNGNPVQAWEDILSDPVKSKEYKQQRGRGGFVRVDWEEVKELISSQLIYEIKKNGPDRIAGFTPIPAMSMLSYASGARFISLLGGTMLSFYDWYADLPPASPQVWGEQTDVPESGDWYNSTYIMVWGSNIPMTRTPDAHFFSEVRYRGAKVVSVSPDYAEYVKFADEWMQLNPGTDAAIAQAMTHVILKEFYVDNPESYFIDYAKQYTDLPFLVMLEKDEDGFNVDRFLRASDLGKDISNAEWKLAVLDEDRNEFVIPNGSVGYRWEDTGKWNLKLEDENGNKINPALTMLGREDEKGFVKLPYFEDDKKGVLKREIPVKKVEINGKEYYLTTVFDLFLANYGVKRDGLEEGYPSSYNDDVPYTPKWQEKITGTPAHQVERIAREFAKNAAESKGRSMIIMGAGINHWYNADLIYRSILNLVILTGSQGKNGGGWAHYVGQEKVRPFEGWATLAFARDWQLPPRLQNATSFWYFTTEQFRYEDNNIERLASPIKGKTKYKHPADYILLAVRLGWLPFYPQFNKSSLKLAEEAKASGKDPKEYVVEKLKSGELEFSIQDPENPVNFPRSLFVWRSNLISSSAKGHEYFLKHMLGVENTGVMADFSPLKPEEVKLREDAPVGKLDLFVVLDFRMTGSALYADVVLPTATWYEKTDLNSTDMHPFIHPLNRVVDPLWESKSDWQIYKELAETFSKLSERYLQGEYEDIVTAPLMHDSPAEIAQPYGKVLDWSKGETEAIPGKTMPNIAVVKRDYTKIYDKYVALGPNVYEKPLGAHGWSFDAKEEYEFLKTMVGTHKDGINKGMPNIEEDEKAVEAILTLSTCTNGKPANKAWKFAAKKTGLPELENVAKDRESEHFTLKEITVQPRVSISTPIFTGTTHLDRRFTAFSNSIEFKMPFRTLSGRQELFIDHELFTEVGENLPVYKPPLVVNPFEDWENPPKVDEKTIKARWITPHGKWQIHSTYYDNLMMLTLFRGGQVVWISDEDAKEAGIKDNDWVEVYNRNGVVVARAAVSHRIQKGMALMYHVQDRNIYVPISELTNETGGSHNATTRIHIKPTYAVGGYAQLSYSFNYYGPTGTQSDSVVLIKKLNKVQWPN